jgi:hypothetical protein
MEGQPPLHPWDICPTVKEGNSELHSRSTLPWNGSPPTDHSQSTDTVSMESCIPGTWALQGHGREGDAALVLKLLIGWTKACEELVVPWLDLQRKLRSVARGTGIAREIAPRLSSFIWKYQEMVAWLLCKKLREQHFQHIYEEHLCA